MDGIHLENFAVKVLPRPCPAQSCRACNANHFIGMKRCPDCGSAQVVRDDITTITLSPASGERVFLYIRESQKDGFLKALRSPPAQKAR